jgi:hypothetical protein
MDHLVLIALAVALSLGGDTLGFEQSCAGNVT